MSEHPRKDTGKGTGAETGKGQDRTDDPKGQANLDKVREMLAPLGRPEKTRLFDMISQGQLQNQMMGPHVARLLVELLNGARAEHARRLWTGWLDPILLRDDLTPLAESRLPASLHVADAGAWWFALSGGMEPLIRRIQTTVAGLALETPLEKIFASAEAKVWAEELRTQSLAVLAGHRGKPAALHRLLAEANSHRTRLLKDRGLPNPGALAPIDIATLVLMLETAPAWKDLGRSAVTTDIDDVLAVATGLIGEGACSPEGAALLALAPIHGSHDPEAAATVGRTLRLAPVREAIIGHFLFAAQLLRQWLDHHYLGKGDALPAVIEAMDPHGRLKNLFGWYDTLLTVDVGRDERTRTLINTTLGGLIDQIESAVVPAVTQRILALTIRSAPQSLIARVEVVAAFHAGFTQRGIATARRPWLTAVADHVVGLFQSLTAAAAQTPRPDHDVMALTRLFDLAMLVGGQIEVTAINKALIAVVEARLRLRTDLDPAERHLVERVVRVAREERKRSKWWVSPEINGLLEIAEQRGVALDLS